ncbi:MAG: putative hydro-lyase [Nocardioidaceae bacterium]
MPGAPPTPGQAGPREARLAFRNGLSTATSGWAPGFTQANLISVPLEYAYDVLLFAQRNPKPCPLLDVTDPGAAATALGEDIDLRTDFPGYRVYRYGELAEEPTDVLDHWRDDLVSFLIGCSFTFEDALEKGGVPVRHRQARTNVPMYCSNIPTRSAGRVGGPTVVSMRPVPASRIVQAVEITARFPTMHGTPLHVGDPAQIGIADLYAPDYGDPPILEPGDVPIFWACGVTPQAAVAAARLPFAIAHAPGQMLITDTTDEQWAL